MSGLLRLLLVLAVALMPIGAAQAVVSHHRASAHPLADISKGGQHHHEHGGGDHHNPTPASAGQSDGANASDDLASGSKSCCVAFQPAVIGAEPFIAGPSARSLAVPLAGDRQLEGAIPLRIDRPPRLM